LNKSDLVTPALLVDYDKMLGNIRAMQSVSREAGVALRPHIKTHKCPEIAKLQLSEGASGICTQTLGEAEVMVESGIRDVFITNHVVGPEKIQRLVRLQEKATVKVAVDSLTNVESIGTAAVSQVMTVPIVLEIDVGMDSYWCGVPFGPAVRKLAGEFSLVEGVRLEGVMTYEGLLPYRIADKKRREQTVACVIERLVEAAEMIRKGGQDVSVVSCGSTLTAATAATVPGVTEIQPGNYVFYDLEQVRMGSTQLDHCALSILTTVTSVPRHDRVVVDGGIKAFCHDQGKFPAPVNQPNLEPVEMYEEQLVLKTSPEQTPSRVGDKIEFIPYHACTATNMHDQIKVISRDELVTTWPIAARGKML
jgi:D-serine deaminase-like pyridoxal phosphate-dependent protein